MAEPDSMVRDDMLRLVFTCCHPALSAEARVALALRALARLEVAAIARAFLVPEATMAKRLVRARQKIAAARIPYRVPSDAELPERLPAVLAVVHLIATEAHAPTGGEEVARVDLEAEAIRLARLVAELMPGEPEVLSLLALLLFTAARRPARTGEDGEPVLLADQDRAVAVGERDGSAALLAALDSLPAQPRSHLWHAARADALHRLGRLEEARHELLTAVDLAPTGPERRLLARRLTALLAGPGHSH